MIKAILRDSVVGKPVSKFSPEVAKDLGKDIVDYLQAMPKGDPLKPLDKDTIVFSTAVKRGYIKADGTVVPPERTLFINKMTGVDTGYGTSASKTPDISEDGFVRTYPLTLEGVKEGIRRIFKAMANAHLE